MAGVLAGLFLLMALPLSAQEPQAHLAGKRVVMTIDDLPCANCAEGSWEQVTEDLLHTLKRHPRPAMGS